MTNMCGSGAMVLCLRWVSTLQRHARLLTPLMFIAHEPQMPSLRIRRLILATSVRRPQLGGR